MRITRPLGGPELRWAGTCFILCVVAVGVLLFGGLGAATQTALYASSTPKDNRRADDAAGAAAGGFLDGATLAIPAPGGRLASKIVAKAITKLLAKNPKAARPRAAASPSPQPPVAESMPN